MGPAGDDASESDRPAPARLRSVVLPLLVLIAGVMLGGCSDASGDPEALSAEEFTDRGNEVCREYDATRAEILGEITDEDGAVDPVGYARLLRAKEASSEILFGLEPPEGFQADWDRMAEIQQEYEDSATARIPEPDIDQRLGPQADQIFRRVGLTACIGS